MAWSFNTPTPLSFRVTRRFAATGTSACLMLSAWIPAQAQELTTTFNEQYKAIKAPDAVTALGNRLFGDQVNLYTGSLEFIHTDLSLPGNNVLPVSVGRRMVAGRYQFDKRAFGRWDLDIPHMHGLFANGISTSPQGWVDSGGTGKRCTNFGAPAETRGLQGSSIWTAEEFWQGSFLYVPGKGDQRLLRRLPDYTKQPAAFSIDNVSVSSFPVVTNSNWAVGCLPSLANGTSSGRTIGEGFVAVSPEGMKYKFDWLVVFPARTLTKADAGPMGLVAEPELAINVGTVTPGLEPPTTDAVINPTMPVHEIWILPTKVVDRFGNTVVYTYDPARPANVKKIESSEGRVLTFTYEQDANGDTHRIKTVSDGTRTVTYGYTPGVFTDLTEVKFADGSSWNFSNLGSLFNDVQYTNSPGCVPHTRPEMTTRTGSMTHPSGAVASFTLTPTEHDRSGVQEFCLDKRYVNPINYYTNSLTDKSISGPGLPVMSWSYRYSTAEGSFDTCTDCRTSKYVDVTDPASHVTRYTYGNKYLESEGKLERIEAGWDGASALRTTEIEYATAPTNEYRLSFGTSDLMLGDAGTDVRNRPEKKRTVTQQGKTFIWEAISFNEFVLPVTVTRSSNLNFSRTEDTVYHNNTARWVLGQIASVTERSSNKVMLSNTYDPSTTALLSTSSYGKLQRSMTYNAWGTLMSVTDGLNQVTTLTGFKRGIPQKITYPDSTSASAIVNNIGKITSITNEAGFTTKFAYDSMGRLASVIHPAADSVAWHPTNIVFTASQSAKYDLPAGHWTQEITTGAAKTLISYDAFWRPVYTEKWDSNSRDNTERITKQKYDHDSRVTFASYARRKYAELSGGVYTAYDALGRPEQSYATSELGNLTTYYAYLGDFETEITDPRGQKTRYRYQAFDEPVDDAITEISLPEAAWVTIERDIFGKPKSIKRHNEGRSKSLTRSYVYNAYMELCKTIEPESGATVMSYDAASNLSWRATGLVLPSTTSCDTGASTIAARKTSFGYDTRNRLKTTTFADSSPSISRTYTTDGLPDTISSGGTIWTYSYNKRRLLETESLAYGGQTYSIGRRYDAYGSLSQLIYPVDGHTVGYEPNALGEPSRVGSYATDILYHPTGAVASFKYGNGIQRTLQLNERGLPRRSTDAGVLDEQYDYDQNANVLKIEDIGQGAATRTMTYDGLNRLSTVAAPGLWEMRSMLTMYSTT